MEKMSPWDLEPLEDGQDPDVRGGSVVVTQEELHSMLYVPLDSEWPSIGRDEECDRIVGGLEKIMELAIAEPFIVPVDMNAYPVYYIIVEYPVDLSMIKARLENRFYR